MTKQTDTHQDERVQLYEVGYLVVPTVAEEQLPGVVQDIKKVLEAHKAVISQEGAPVLRDLAYEIAKVSVGKRNKFSRAYFGWIRFNADPAEVVGVQKKIEEIKELLRFILIKTDEEIVIPLPAVEVKTEEAPAENTEVKVSEEELDKKIDNLVVA